MPVSGDFLSISSRVHIEGAPLEVPSKEPLQREMLHPQSPLHPALKFPGRTCPPPGYPNGDPMERDTRLQSLFYISFRVPSKGAPTPSWFPSQSSHRERDNPHPEPLSTISQSLWLMSPLEIAPTEPP